MPTSDIYDFLVLSPIVGGKMPDSPLLRRPMKVAHRIFEKKNVLEKISSDLATLVGRLSDSITGLLAVIPS